MMHHFSEFNVDFVDRYEVSRKKKRKDLPYEYECDDILVFDSEASSAWRDENGNIIKYTACMSEEYWNKMIALAVEYIWMFSYNDTVYYGRELKDFRYILDRLDKNTHYIIYVHNLSYDFQFISNILTWKQVFARNAHKVMYCIAAEYENIEFRCSYFLTRISLKEWGNELGTVRKLDTLVYDSKIRTPKTKLTQQEMDYCEHDCLVVYEGIKKYREQYAHVERIPLTQTGEVRRVLRRKVIKNRALQRRMVSLIPDAKTYRMLKQAFAGGYTHANFTMAGRVIRSKDESGLYHFDFASSYPYCMLAFKYPQTPFVECDFERDFDEYAYLIRIRVHRLKAKTYNHFISASKCFTCEADFIYDEDIDTVDNLELDNGRVISNAYIDDNQIKQQEFDMFITEQDLDMIEKTYNIDYDIVECYKSKKQYLPIEIIEYILELYKNKTELKQKESDVDFDETLFNTYMTSKKFINALFGMCCTDIVQDDVRWNGGDWETDEKGFFDVEDGLAKLREDNKNRTFMNFAWGVWITAYARHNLWECILMGDNGDDINSIIYCDTDSIFCRDFIDFTEYNNGCRKKLEKMCKFYNLDVALTEPCDRKGVKHPIGVFVEEDRWLEFITLGAKRYCVRELHDRKLHLTVSGINKEAVAVLNDNIENFNEDLVFDKDAECVHKMMLTYINNQKPVIFNRGEDDEYYCTDKFGINMRNTSYSMNSVSAYLEFINRDDVISHLACFAS